MITTTATYVKGTDGLPLYAYDASSGEYHYTLLNNGTMSMSGYGQNSLDDKYFAFVRRYGGNYEKYATCWNLLQL